MIPFRTPEQIFYDFLNSFSLGSVSERTAGGSSVESVSGKQFNYFVFLMYLFLYLKDTNFWCLENSLSSLFGFDFHKNIKYFLHPFQKS